MPVGSVASSSSFGSPETQATYGGCYGRLSILSDHSFPLTNVAAIEKKTSLDWIKVPVYRSVIIDCIGPQPVMSVSAREEGVCGIGTGVPVSDNRLYWPLAGDE